MDNQIKLAIQGGEEIYRNVSVERLVKAATKYGIKYLELLPDNISKDGVVRTQEILEKHKLGVAAITSWTRLNLPGDVVPKQRSIMEAIESAKKLDARFVITYFGPNPLRSERKAIEIYKRNIALCIEKARRMEITILIENEFDHLNEDPTKSDITRRVEVKNQI